MASLSDMIVHVEVDTSGMAAAIEEAASKLHRLGWTFEEAADEIVKTWSEDLFGFVVEQPIMELTNEWREYFAEGETKMARKKKAASPFRKGRASTRKSSGGSQFLSIKDGESETFAPLVGLADMVSAEMHEYWDIRPAFYHPCIGRGCPGCEVENEPRFKGYLPVAKKDGSVMIFPFTISVYNQLEELEDELEGGSLKGYVIKFSRRGSGMATRYTVLGLGKRIDVDDKEVPDFISQLGPQTKEDITELLVSKGLLDETDEEPAKETKAEAEEEVAEDVADEDDDWGDE